MLFLRGKGSHKRGAFIKVEGLRAPNANQALHH